MKLRAMVTAVAAASMIAGAFAGPARADDKSDIEALEKRVGDAIEAKDAAAVMANYISGDSLIVFDVVPPRQYVGSDSYKKDWAELFSGCADAPKFQISDLTIESSGKLAYSHSIQHFKCTDPKGGKLDMTFRATDVYRKTSGKWLIAHEHLSVPADPGTGKADLTSKP